MIRPLARHRIASLLPILLLGLAALVGGWVNRVDLNGRVLDDFTDAGIGTAKVSHGSRSVTADPSGSFTFPNLPRLSRIGVDAPGYLRTGADTTQELIRMSPLSLTVEVIEAGNKDKHIPNAQIRQGDKLLSTTTEAVTVIITPHPGKDAKLLICAAGYNKKEIDAKGVLITVELTPGTDACAPLPTPSPTPSPSPSPSPAQSPSPTPTPSPTASP